MKRFPAAWIIMAAGLLSILACRNPALTGTSPRAGDSGATLGTDTRIGIRLSRLSPVFGDLLMPSAGDTGSSSSSRAIIGASRAEFRLYASGNPTPVEEWSWNVFYRNDGSSWDSLWLDYHALSVSGSGYALEVDIFNDAVSTTEPVVTGSATDLDIVEGQHTDISIRCLPVSPTLTLTPGTLIEVLEPVLTPFVFVGSSLTELGQEAWYKLELSGNRLMLECSLEPTNTATVAAVLYDQSGAIEYPVNFSATASQPFSKIFSLPAGTYYLGVAQSRELGPGAVQDRDFTLTLIDGPLDPPQPTLVVGPGTITANWLSDSMAGLYTLYYGKPDMFDQYGVIQGSPIMKIVEIAAIDGTLSQSLTLEPGVTYGFWLEWENDNIIALSPGMEWRSRSSQAIGTTSTAAAAIVP